MCEVGHTLGLKGMGHPEQRHRQREPRSRVSVAGPQALGQQRPSDEAKERQGRQDMDHQVDDVVSPHVEAAEGVIEGERQLHRWPMRASQEPSHRPGVADIGIVADGMVVIEDERTGEAVVVRGETDDDDGPSHLAKRGAFPLMTSRLHGG